MENVSYVTAGTYPDVKRVPNDIHICKDVSLDSFVDKLKAP